VVDVHKVQRDQALRGGDLAVRAHAPDVVRVAQAQHADAVRLRALCRRLHRDLCRRLAVAPASLHDEHGARVEHDRGLLVRHDRAAEGRLRPVLQLIGVVVHHADAMRVVALDVGGHEVRGDDGRLRRRAAAALDHPLDQHGERHRIEDDVRHLWLLRGGCAAGESETALLVPVPVLVVVVVVVLVLVVLVALVLLLLLLVVLLLLLLLLLPPPPPALL
jgi:hypothetical protein